MKKLKRMIIIAVIGVFAMTGVTIATFDKDTSTSYAAQKTFVAVAYCKKCDPKHRHVYKGTSNTSTSAARANAKTKCQRAGHTKKSCKIAVTTQY